MRERAVPVAGNIGNAIIGSFGTLTLNGDGSYNYTPDLTNPAVAGLVSSTQVVDAFTYEVTDADGSTDTATLTITVTGTPAIVSSSTGSATATEGSVLESDLAVGTNPAGVGDALTGSFSAVAPDGLARISINGTSITEASLLGATPGAPVTVMTTIGTLELTGYDAATGKIDYSYSLDGVQDHTGGAVTDTLSVSVTDVDGDVGNGTLRFEVVDDEPITANDLDTVSEDGTGVNAVATGNVFTGVDVAGGDSNGTDGVVDTIGADSVASPVSGVIAGSGSPVAGNVGSSVAGSYGSLTLNANGNYEYTPDNANSTVDALSVGDTLNDVFTYEITDSDGSSRTASLTITISGVNDAPVADDESFVTNEDTTSGSIDLLTGDTDVDGDTLSIQSINGTTLTPGAAQTIAVTNGTVNVSAAGVVTFTPTANYNGPITFDYVVSDGNGGTDTGTVTGTVTAVNDPPVADDESFTTAEDTTSGTIDLLTGDTDLDGDTLSIQSINGTTLTPGTAQTIAVTNGTVNVSAAGVVTFTPALNYNGSVTFDYVVSDGNGGTDTGTVTGAVTAVNDPPVADDESFTTAEDTTSGTIDLLTGDTDLDGDTLSIQSINGTTLTPGTAQTIAVTNGTVNVSAAGVVTFTPTANYNGPITFDYVVSDGNGGTDIGTVTGTVTAVNDPPVADDESFVTAEDTATGAIDLLTGDTDVDGDTLSIQSINGTTLTPGTAQAIAVTNGTVNVSTTGVVTFTPAANYHGSITFDYVVSDVNGGIDTGTVTGTVTAVNDPPVADDDSFSVNEDTTSGTIDLLTGDTDLDGDTLSIQSISGTTLTPGTAQTIAVTNGTVNVSAAGVVTFTPTANYNGSITFDYVVSDGNGGTDTGTVTGTVTAVNDPPVADDESFTTAEDTTSGTIDLLTGDTDLDGDTLSIQSISGTTLTPGIAQTIAVTNGTVNVSAASVVTFTPTANYNGSITFDYVVSDGNGGIDTGTVTGTVTAANDAPVADDDSFSVNEDTTSGALDLLTGDTDVDGDTLSIQSINGTTLTPGTAQTIAVANGTVNVSSAGVVTFTPALNYNGSITFDYIVSDGNGGTDTGMVTGTVIAVNDPPVADDDHFSVNEGTTSGSIDLLTGDTDVDGDTLSVQSINGTTLTPGTAQTIAVTNGTVNVSAAGVVIFTPAANYNGSITFDYVVSDGNGGIDTGTVTGTVKVVDDSLENSPPVADDESFIIDEDTSSGALGLLTGDTDADGDTLSIQSINGTPLTPGTAQTIAVPNGTVNVSAAGVVTFTPAANYHGSITFDYVVSDGNGGIDTGTVTGTVKVVDDSLENSPPVADDESFIIDEDTSSGALGLLIGDTDVDGDTLSIQSINGTPLTPGTVQTIAVTNGTVNVSAAGVATFTPAANYNGSITFNYVVSDGNGGTDTGTVTGTVLPVNDPPIAIDDGPVSFTVNTAITGSVLINDSDVDGDTLSVTQFTVVGVSGIFMAGETAFIEEVGTLVINGDGNYAFTPALDYTGVIPTATYTISDGNGGTDTATLSFASGSSPIAIDDGPVEVTANTIATGSVLINDRDEDGDLLTVTQFTVAGVSGIFTAGEVASIGGVGTLVINIDGSYAFTPALDYTGALPAVVYTISDGNGGTDTANLTFASVAPIEPSLVVPDNLFNADTPNSISGLNVKDTQQVDRQRSAITSSNNLHILQRVENIDSLGSIFAISGDSRLHILNAIQSISDLNSSQAIAANGAVSDEVARMERMTVDSKPWQTTTGVENEQFVLPEIRHSFVFSGTGLDVMIDGEAARRYLSAYSYFFGRMINIQFEHVGEMDKRYDVDLYTVMGANGEHLPEWLNFNAQTGLLSGVPPIGEEFVRLQIKAQLHKGVILESALAINTTTGRIMNAQDANNIN